MKDRAIHLSPPGEGLLKLLDKWANEEFIRNQITIDMKELTKYQSIKKVWAFKIAKIEVDKDDGSGILFNVEEGYPPQRVDSDYMYKHNPQEGGYYVVYADGYTSFCPAEAFEEGNVPIKETTFLERLIIEEKELGEKIVALNKALNSPGFPIKVGYFQFELLNLQHGAMITYRRVLTMRINHLKDEALCSRTQ